MAHSTEDYYTLSYKGISATTGATTGACTSGG